MTDREKVIKGLGRVSNDIVDGYITEPDMACNTINYAIDLLKAQKEATIEPKRIDLEEETKAWLDKMDAVDALGNIADICIDWDGYRTADGLGGLVNEIWAYARYCADRIAKAQEPVEPVPGLWDRDIQLYKCGACGGEIGAGGIAKYCFNCGRKVKWE